MRGSVAISVTAAPAAAPRRSREVLRIIIREPSGLRLRPTMGPNRWVPRPSGTPNRVWVGWHRSPRASADARTPSLSLSPEFFERKRNKQRCVDMELTRFHWNLRAPDKTFSLDGFDLPFHGEALSDLIGRHHPSL